MELTVIGVDIAKTVFQLHWVDPQSGVIERLKLKRAQVLPWFANRPSSLVMMEACGGAHEWGRQLMRLGHQVRLLPAKTVRPFVQRNKTDAADAQAIWTAGQQPGARFVAVKTVAQQVVLSLHRLRAQLMKMRIMQTNELRGLLAEFGATARGAPGTAATTARRVGAGPGAAAGHARGEPARASPAHPSPGGRHRAPRTAPNRAAARDTGLSGARRNPCRLLTATAVVASMGSPAAFKDGREFAAWIGLVPRQTGTGGRIRQLGISKRGDAYLRTLLMHGARAIVRSDRSRVGHGWPPCCSGGPTAWSWPPSPTNWPGPSGRCWRRTRPWQPHAWQAA